VIIKKRIDNMFHAEINLPDLGSGPRIQIIKTSNGVPVPDDEPLFVIRGRDRLAIKAVKAYRQLAIEDGVDPDRIKLIDMRIAEYEQFAEDNPLSMKQPGITKGR
jgi:hypothetical protein